MDVTPHELRTIEVREAWRGYRQDDVDELLDRVAGTIERLQAQVQRLTERVAKAEDEAGMGREADEMLRRTLLLAQRTADAAVSEAQERARRVVSESEAQANSIVSGAEAEARRVAVGERRRLEDEVREMSRRRDLLISDLEVLDETTHDHRRRLREFMESELARLESRPVPPAPARPQLHEVEVPDEPAGEEPALDPVPVPSAAGGAEAGTPGDAPADDADAAADDVEGEAEVEEPGAVEDAGEAVVASVTDEPAPAEAEAEVVGAVGEAGEGADFDAFAELDGGMADLLPRRRRRYRRPAGDDPDDEFFSELRAAVTDETPLGPVDDPDDPDDPGHGGARDAYETRDPYAGDDTTGDRRPDLDLDLDEPGHRDLGGLDHPAVTVPAGPPAPDDALFFDQDAVGAPDERREHHERPEPEETGWDEFDDGIPDGNRLGSVFRRRG